MNGGGGGAQTNEAGNSPTLQHARHANLQTRPSQQGDGYLILLRHGLSIWNHDPAHPNEEWRYAGSTDVPLSTHGVTEAIEAGNRMRDFRIDVVYTSTLCRATMTAFLALGKHIDRRPVVWYRDASMAPPISTEAKLDHVPMICCDWLNERNCGDLEGVSSRDHVTPNRTAEDLARWRNSYREKFPGAHGESAQDVFNRVVPRFLKEISPLIVQGKNVLIVTHGFVLRALTKFLEEMSDSTYEAEMLLEKGAPQQCRLLAPTGAPLVYKLMDIATRSFQRLEGDLEFELRHTEFIEKKGEISKEEEEFWGKSGGGGTGNGLAFGAR